MDILHVRASIHSFQEVRVSVFSKHFLDARDAAINKATAASASAPPEFTLLSPWICLNETHHPHCRVAHLLPVASGLRA